MVYYCKQRCQIRKDKNKEIVRWQPASRGRSEGMALESRDANVNVCVSVNWNTFVSVNLCKRRRSVWCKVLQQWQVSNGVGGCLYSSSVYDKQCPYLTAFVLSSHSVYLHFSPFTITPSPHHFPIVPIFLRSLGIPLPLRYITGTDPRLPYKIFLSSLILCLRSRNSFAPLHLPLHSFSYFLPIITPTFYFLTSSPGQLVIHFFAKYTPDNTNTADIWSIGKQITRDCTKNMWCIFLKFIEDTRTRKFLDFCGHVKERRYSLTSWKSFLHFDVHSVLLL